MKIVEFLTEKFKCYLNLSQEETEILEYGFSIMYTTVFGYAVILAVSYLLNIFHIVLPMMITHSILRAVSGGAHGSKFVYCWSSSVIVFNTLGLIASWSLNQFTWSSMSLLIFDFIAFCFAFYIVYKKAPVDVVEKPITSEKQRKTLRKLSLYFVLVWYTLIFGLIQTTGDTYKVFLLATGMGIGWQSFTLTKWGMKFAFLYGKGLQTLGI